MLQSLYSNPFSGRSYIIFILVVIRAAHVLCLWAYIGYGLSIKSYLYMGYGPTVPAEVNDFAVGWLGNVGYGFGEASECTMSSKDPSAWV